MDIKLINKDNLLDIEKCGRDCLPIYYTKSDLINLLYDSNYVIYVCFIKNEVTGFVVANVYDKRTHIMSIAVYEKYRNMNIGTNLINKLKDVYKKNVISLNVQRNNQIAIKFYKKNNFVISELLKDYYSNLDCNDAYQMIYF